MIRALLLLVLAQLVVAGSLGFELSNAAYAQEATEAAPDYEAWDRVAVRAEEAVSTATASDDALVTLRQTLADWRDRFLQGQGSNSERISTLREQIASLGPAPEEGTTEPEEIATRRATLQEQLDASLAPVRRAEEAFTRADGLIREIDGILRDRTADQVLRLDPTPLNPANWPASLTALTETGRIVQSEIDASLASDLQRRSVRNGLPLTIVLIIVSLFLMFRSSVMIDRGLLRLKERTSEKRARFRVGAFVASLFGVLLPVLGAILFIRAIDQTGLAGLVGSKLLELLAMAVVVIAGGRWLSRQIFPALSPPEPLLPWSDKDLRKGRLAVVALAVLYALYEVVQDLASFLQLSSAFTIEARSVLLFPITLIAGLALIRLGRILSRGETAQRASASADTSNNPIWSVLPRACLLLGVVGPALSAIGYVAAGGLLVFATALTLGLLGLVSVLQRFATDLYAMVVRDEARAASGLVPVLVGALLSLGALPILALIWGARGTDLSEAWTMISQGFQVGESRITPTVFLTFVVVFALGYMLTRFLQSMLKSRVLPKTRLDVGGRNAIVSGTGYVGIFFAALIAITSAGLDLSSLAIVAGALSVGIGFGLQTIVSNFVSGIILLVERPISEGDWIEVGGTMGVVKSISVRATTVETFDRRDVIVPNADLITTSVTNWTKDNLNGRIIIPIGVAYGTDTKKIETILREIAEAHPAVVLNPPPSIVFVGFGADSLDFEIRAILRDVNFSLSTRSEINHEIARRFTEEEIEIPFNQRDIWLRNPEALQTSE